MYRTTFRGLKTALCLLFLLCVPSLASADSLTWTLSGVVFNDGGTASGSFVYDAVTNKFSSINIVTTAGSTFGGATYQDLNPGFAPLPNSIVFVPNPNLANFTGTMLLDLELGPPLTNLGGTVGFTVNAFEGICGLSDCTNFAPTPFRVVTAGELVSSPVTTTPEPSALWLSAVGLVVLMGALKRTLLRA